MITRGRNQNNKRTGRKNSIGLRNGGKRTHLFVGLWNMQNKPSGWRHSLCSIPINRIEYFFAVKRAKFTSILLVIGVWNKSRTLREAAFHAHTKIARKQSVNKVMDCPRSVGKVFAFQRFEPLCWYTARTRSPSHSFGDVMTCHTKSREQLPTSYSCFLCLLLPR